MAVVTIPLRNRAGMDVAVAVVDVADARLAARRWYRLANGYAVRTETRGGRKRMVYLHRAVLGLRAGDRRQVDHRNGNKLDNRRANLRAVTPPINASNRGANRGRRLPRNVYRCSGSDTYRVQLKVQGEPVHIGTFRTVREAAGAARAARLEHGVASVADLQVAKAVLDQHHGGGA